MGNIGSEFVYMPMDDGGHYVDGMLYHNGREVGTLQGTYQSADEGYVDATFGMNRLPMELLNGFVPDRIIGLRGYGATARAILPSRAVLTGCKWMASCAWTPPISSVSPTVCRCASPRCP